MPNAIPAGFHTLTPTLVYKNAQPAIDFYQKAFGAKQEFILKGPDGKRVSHAVIRIGDSPIMMCDEGPSHPHKSAETWGHSPVAFYLYVPDVDASFKKATAAGAKVTAPLTDMFWGDRVGTIQDPFGYEWTFATHTRDVSDQEIRDATMASRS